MSNNYLRETYDRYSKETKELLKKYKNSASVPIIKIAHDLGLKIFMAKDLPDKFCGALRKEGEDFVIYVNKDHCEERKKFTIAHEIAHFLEHKELIASNDYATLNRQKLKDEEGDEVINEKEVEANKLASILLMPKKKFKDVWEKANSIEEVASEFEVSVSAATLRGDKLLREMII